MSNEEILTPQERRRMKTLLHEFWWSWETWLAIVGSVLGLASLVILGMWLQRANYEQTIRAEVRQLAEDIRQGQHEREQLKQAIGNLEGQP